jgi:hypothetical protein
MIEYYKTELNILQPYSRKTQTGLLKDGGEAGVRAVIPADRSFATVSGQSVVNVQWWWKKHSLYFKLKHTTEVGG